MRGGQPVAGGICGDGPICGDDGLGGMVMVSLIIWNEIDNYPTMGLGMNHMYAVPSRVEMAGLALHYQINCGAGISRLFCHRRLCDAAYLVPSNFSHKSITSFASANGLCCSCPVGMRVGTGPVH